MNYNLVGFLPATEHYLIQVSGYEGSESWLLSARTGMVTKLRDIPHFAPDGATFFVSGFDGTYESSLSIGSLTSDASAIVWETFLHRDETWVYQRWIDNDQIALRAIDKSESCPGGNCDAILRRAGNAWTLDRLPNPYSNSK